MSACPAKDQIGVTVSGPCVLERKEAAYSFSVAFKSPQRRGAQDVRPDFHTDPEL